MLFYFEKNKNKKDWPKRAYKYFSEKQHYWHPLFRLLFKNSKRDPAKNSFFFQKLKKFYPTKKPRENKSILFFTIVMQKLKKVWAGYKEPTWSDEKNSVEIFPRKFMPQIVEVFSNLKYLRKKNTELRPKPNRWRNKFIFKASAIALAPSSPISLDPK